VKGPHEECGFRLTCGLKRFLLYGGEEVGSIVPYGLHTTSAALVDLAGIFLPPSFYRDIKQDYWLLVALLAGHGRCPPEHGNNHINQSINPAVVQQQDSDTCHTFAQLWLQSIGFFQFNSSSP
jgi:hypothetical protein